MKLFNKIAFVCGFIFLGLSALVGCEDEHFYEVDSPDWLSEVIDSLSSSTTTEVVDFDGMEDVYIIGETDYSSSWWTAFSKYYQVPNGEEWQARFTLNINPSGTLYYQNFALVITNDEDRNTTNYKEYGAIRFDATNDSVSYNSQWGSDYYYLPFAYTSATLLFSPDEDNNVTNLSSLGGTVTISVDRTDANAFTVTMTNGTQTKTYAQPYALGNLNTDASNETIRCFLCPEGSYISFQKTSIEPIGGVTSSEDKNPVSMVLENVPEYVEIGSSLESVMADVTAVVTFEEDVTKTVTADDLIFSSIPDISTTGEKTLVAIYNLTYNGEYCETPIIATATFTVEDAITAIDVTTQPTRTTYYYYETLATENMSDRTLAFDPTGMVVTATYQNGGSETISNSRLSFSAVTAEEGSQTVTITYGNVSTTVEVTVNSSVAEEVQNSANVVGEDDNTTAFWGAFSDDFSVPAGTTRYVTFTNYTDGVNNYDNFVVVLRDSEYNEYAVVRADNYGWGNGYDSATLSGGQSDWSAWLAAMDGAKVTVYVTNCNNGTADVQCVMQGNDGVTYTQYYLGISSVDLSDLTFALTTEAGHLVFNE